MSNVTHPAHYNTGKIEVIEAIEDWKLSYHRGNVVKYVARAGKKDPTKTIEDLEKAKWYLEREIERLRAAKESREPVRPNDMNPRPAETKTFIPAGQVCFPGHWRLTTDHHNTVCPVEVIAFVPDVPFVDLVPLRNKRAVLCDLQ